MSVSDEPNFSAELLLVAAGKHLHAGDLTQAEAFARQIFELDAPRAPAFMMLGVIALRGARPSQAADHFRQAILAGGGGIAQALLGDALLDQRSPHDALAAYDRALGEQPALQPALFGRANACLALGRLDEAFAGFDHLTMLQSDNPEIWHQRGVALLRQNRPATALDSFDAALALHPDHPAALFYQAQALQALGRSTEALEALRVVTALCPQDADAGFARARLLAQMGRHAEAIAEFDRLLALEPAAGDVHCDRAESLLVLQRAAEALQTLQSVLADRAPFPRAARLCGEACRLLGREQDAARYDALAVAGDPGSARRVTHDGVGAG